MRSRTRVIITFAFLVILVALLYFFAGWFSISTGYSTGENPNVVLSKCLLEKGAKLYGSASCPDCKKQENLFGSNAFNYLNYINCANDPGLCNDLESLPAWEIQGRMYYGVKELDELRKLSECY